MVELSDIARFLAPLVTGFVAGRMCPVKDAGSDIPARPPASWFGVIWTILYILIGFAWVKAARLNRNYDIAFIVLVFLLCLWTYYWGCEDKKKSALYVLFLAVLVSLCIMLSMLFDGERLGLLLAPLIVWLLLAGQLNYTEVNNTLKTE